MSADLDESVAELIVSGRAASLAGTHPDPGVGAVAEFVADLQSIVALPAAPASPALAAILRDGLPEARAVVVPPHRPRRPARWRRSLAAAGLAIGVGIGGVTAAAAANLLPDGAQRVVGSVVKALSPFEVPAPGPAATPSAPSIDGARPRGDTTSEPAGGVSGPDAPVPPRTTDRVPGPNPPALATPGPSPGSAVPSAPSPVGSGTTGPTAAGPGSSPFSTPSIPDPSVPTTPPPATVPSIPTTIPPAPSTTLPPLPLP